MKDPNLALLGFKVKDRVTGFVGVVTSISYDLYGCIQAVVTPEIKPDNKDNDSRWFDLKRLSAVDTTPVMEQPVFAGATAMTVQGPQEKPLP